MMQDATATRSVPRVDDWDAGAQEVRYIASHDRHAVNESGCGDEGIAIFQWIRYNQGRATLCDGDVHGKNAPGERFKYPAPYP